MYKCLFRTLTEPKYPKISQLLLWDEAQNDPFYWSKENILVYIIWKGFKLMHASA